MRSRLALLVFSSSFTLFSCAHSQLARAPREKAVAEAETDEQTRIPVELWSPARKKANASYYFMAGEFEVLSRNLPQASKLLETSYNLDPNPYVAAKMIEAKAVMDIDSALALGKKTSLLYPKSPEIQLLYGRLQIAKGDLKGAETALKQTIKMRPGDIEAYVFLVQVYETQERFKEAIAITKDLLAKNSDFADGWTQLAKLYVVSKDLPKALEASRKAYDLASSDVDKVHLYATLLSVTGQRAKAASIYQKLIDLNVTQEEIIDQMVELYKQLGTLEEALAQLKKTEAAAGKDVNGVRLQMGFVYWELKRYDEASAVFDQIAGEYPQNERFTFMTALGKERLGQIEKALAIYKGFDSSSEFYLSARLRAIDLTRENGDMDGALAIAKEVIKSHVERSEDFYTIGGGLLAAQKKYKEAVALLEEGYGNFPDRVDFLFAKAVNQERAGDVSDCVVSLKEVLKKDPQHSPAMNYLGYLYAERGTNLDEAETHIKKALEIKPDDGYYLDSLGWVYYQKGQYEMALEVLLRAQAKIEDEATILEHLGDTYAALKKSQEALTWYERASKAKMDEKDLERVMKKYETYKAKFSS